MATAVYCSGLWGSDELGAGGQGFGSRGHARDHISNRWWHLCVQILKTKNDTVNQWDRSCSEHMAASILHWVDLLLNALQSRFCIGSIFFWTHGSFYFELGRSSSESLAVSILYWVDLLLSILKSLFNLVESDGNIQSQSAPLHSWYDDAMMILQVNVMMCIP